jgi:DNA-binding transcriptional LysR family regulator
MAHELLSTSLEQWIVLQTVIEEGSYASAAERLHRSQSSISYALRSLQAGLGVQLLQIVGRKASLTETGRLMLIQVQPLLANFRQLESRARSLQAGTRASLSLIVDTVFPKPILFTALKHFQQHHPGVQIHVREVLRTESEPSLARQEADIYILALRQESAISGNFLMDIDFIAVAHPTHPLHHLQSPLSAAQLEQYPLVTLADRAPQRTQLLQTYSLWSFSTIEAAIEAICYGVGYGWLPLGRIQALLDTGRLKHLPVTTQQIRKTPLYLAYGKESLQYDPTVAALADILRTEIARSTHPHPGTQIS